MTDIQIRVLDLEKFLKTKERHIDYCTIGTDAVESTIENWNMPEWLDWFRVEHETVRDLMLAGF